MKQVLPTGRHDGTKAVIQDAILGTKRRSRHRHVLKLQTIIQTIGAEVNGQAHVRRERIARSTAYRVQVVHGPEVQQINVVTAVHARACPEA